MALFLLTLPTGARASDYTFSTIAGKAGVTGNADGTNGAARFNYPNGLAIDGSSNVFVADWVNQTIRKITPDGAVTTFAGLALEAGNTDGAARSARFINPAAVAFDRFGNLYVADFHNRAIRKISPDGTVSTLAGGSYGIDDGLGTKAQFEGPNAVAVDSQGNVIVGDIFANTIRRISPDGMVTTLAGLGYLGGPGGGINSSVDGTGKDARFYQPYGIAVDIGDNVYVADAGNNTIRKVTPGGVVTTIAGQARIQGTNDGIGGEARFNFPISIAIDQGGNVLVLDRGGRTIRQITPQQVVTTLIWRDESDPNGSDGQFVEAQDIVVAQDGTLYVAESMAVTIRKGTPTRSLFATKWANGSFTASFRSLKGVQYQWEYAETLPPTVWNKLEGQILGDGGLRSLSDGTAAKPQRFYRLQQ